MEQKKRIIITGACGFIGSHFVQLILERTDWEVVALVGLKYASDVNRLAFVGREAGWERLTFIYHDLREPIPDQVVDRIGPVDYVATFASQSDVQRSLDNPAEFVKENVAIALAILEYARVAKPEKFILVSTDEVFGPAALGTSALEWDPHIPSNPYAASKSAQEAIAISYWRSYGVPVVITNTMNNYGPGQHPEKFVPKVVQAVLSGTQVRIHGEPHPLGGWSAGSRVWLHARDHADALVWILENITPASFGDSDRPDKFNVAGEVEVDNLDLAERIADALGLPLDYAWENFHASRPGHDLRYSLDGTKLSEAGWKRPRTFAQGLKETVLALAKRPPEKPQGDPVPDQVEQVVQKCLEAWADDKGRTDGGRFGFQLEKGFGSTVDLARYADGYDLADWGRDIAARRRFRWGVFDVAVTVVEVEVRTSDSAPPENLSFRVAIDKRP
jgi:dTDP-glucose 4,6-dehydratase